MKKLLLPLFLILLLTACKKEITKEKVPEEKGSVTAAKGPPAFVDVCHYDAVTNTWSTINVPINALPAHLAHGDIVPDEDNDGYTKVNPCGNGSQDDCNDGDAAINPGVTEVCGNNIDDNCNGQIDEGCCPNNNSVQIGNQEWMTKNLDVDKYRDGTPIPEVQDPTAWSLLTTGAWCWYANNSANGTTYGKLYNWYAVNDPRGLAPAGWHVPTDAEWTTLSSFLGGESVAGGKMKSTGTIEASTGLWSDPNTDATNSTCFRGLPGGIRGFDGFFYVVGLGGYWWSVTEHNTIYYSYAWNRALLYSYGNINRNSQNKRNGLSVRCIKD